MENENTARSEANPAAIVGIGASAGGLAALKTFFAHIPQDSGLAFVIVVHLSPDHESHLADLLQPHVPMPVEQVTETLPLEANHVYVIPPGCNLNTIDTHLRLSDLEEHRKDRAPIDHFFRTLAIAHNSQAIGIILTGTGSDGTLGIREIKQHGGLTIVQDPLEAEYDGMPQSAIATGMIDLILPLENIPEQIMRFSHTKPQIAVPKEGENTQEEEQQLLQKIFAQLRARSGRDFSRYKPSTIMRRLQRRMQLHQIIELKDYLNLLRENPDEVRALSDDFLITVTNFFRDPEVFEQLEKEVIPALFKGKGPEDSVRIWTVGCATGEEAYSMAILLLEEAAKREAPPKLQVFASDLHEHSLKKAREGYYPGDVETEVSAERLKRFFVKVDGSFRICKEVREIVVFTPHNLLSDPPFSKLDLIACRNLLIYLQRQVQKEIIELFHYALNAEGFLLLGTSESIEGADLFRTEHKGHCLFRKRNVPGPEPRLPVFPLSRPRLLDKPEAERAEHTGGPLAFGMLHQRMVEQYAPPSLLVSADHKVVHFSEHVGRYLVHPGGEPTTSVFKLVREELRVELQAALHAARKQKKAVRSKPVPVRMDGELRLVELSVHPAKEPQQESFSLVIFDEQQVSKPVPAVDTHDTTVRDATIRELEQELEMTREQLQAVIEEYETSQEEMKASNEEMQSTNEELRSTLEELETGKEELQSMNEELSTVNQENRHKVEELAQLSADLHNLLKATDIATLFLDKQLRILRFTPKVGELFNMRMVDRGRPISDLTHQLGYDELQRDARQVLDKLVPVEREVQDKESRWYLTRVLPYRSSEDRIEGVVITFVDITKLKQIEETLRQREEHLQLILESATDYAIFTLDMNRKITDWNIGAEQILGYKKEEAIGESGDMIFTAEDRQHQAPEKEAQIAITQGSCENERWHVRKDGSLFWGSGMTMPLRTESREIRGFLKIMADDTKRKQMEEALKRSKEQAEKAARAKEEFLAHMSHEIRTPLSAVIGLTNLLITQNAQPALAQYLQTLKFSAESLRLLVNDILDFSKIEAGKISVEEKQVRLRELLYGLEKAHEPRAQEQGNELQVHVDEKIPEVVCTDELKLSQVLNNLISNAVKFTHQGLVTVEISLNRKEEKRLWIDFSIRDTGIGIPEDKQATIFAPFTQVDISTVRKYEGTGLGLSITKLLLELLGSQIKVESQPGKGSRFFFTLPVKEDATSTVDVEKAVVESEGQKDLSHMQLLLVEDTEINRLIIKEFLQDWWQLAADEAENGEQAVKMAAQKQYDLILLDVRMPLMDGYQAAKIIRELPESTYQNVPIIALTADTVNELEKHPEASFFTDVITKPFDPQELQQKIFHYALNALNNGMQLSSSAEAVIAHKPSATEATGASAAYEVDLKEISTMLKGDKQRIKNFLQKAIPELKTLQENLEAAIAGQDEEALDDIVHKATMLLNILSLPDLQASIAKCQALLKENATQAQLNEARQEVKAAIEQIVTALKQHLKKNK